MNNDERPDVERELARLKDFQRKSVDYAFRRLWTDADHTNRFLVADEVGLGKTLVARGVIARTVDWLWEREERIDVIYICSNTQIARQNIGRLNIGGFSVDHADRLSLLPTVLGDLRKNRVNFVSFTPGTSFHIAESGGKAEERVVLQLMLAKAWGREVINSAGWLKFFRGGSNLDNYRGHLRGYDASRIDADLALQFSRDVDTATAYDGQPLAEALDQAVDRFRWNRSVDQALSRHRYRLIGQLRNLVAQAAVQSLEPDLVILDEFQRFKDLLDPSQPGAALAHEIFGQPTARVLLLSATPYKMYTLPDEPEGDDHYEDFRKTVEFLGGAECADHVARGLRTVRETVLGSGDSIVAIEAKRQVEEQLRRVMCRTERLAATADRDGMLVESPVKMLQLDPLDIRTFRSCEQIAKCVDRQDVFEYWRSSPYLFNIMEGYQVKRRLRDNLAKASDDLVKALREAEGLLDWKQLKQYRRLDPGNAKMRALVHDVLDRGMWQLLWLPPSLPYYEPRGVFADPDVQAFTKRLIFSAWAVVPKAISVVLSYEAERRAIEAAGGTARAYDADRPTGLLRFQIERDGGGRRAAGMPVLALLWPARRLATLGDPLAVARATGAQLPLARADLEAHVRQSISEALATLPQGSASGAVDQRWYWAAPFLLDSKSAEVDDGLLETVAEWWGDDDEDAQSRFTDHIDEAMQLDPETLGRRPDDLVDVLTALAISGPGVCALRTLTRVCVGRDLLNDGDVGFAALGISWGLRSLFNRPESMSVVRTESDAEPYWLAVLRYCVDGNLQAVLDEYAHVLVESEGMQDLAGSERAESLRIAMANALSLRASRATVDSIVTKPTEARLDSYNVRTHFAARFGRAVTEDAAVQREGLVRDAYNSPFWPFVLASTSVGQEGLDFHTFSHAVVHWNLPGNPVDLEQREGRVHRYKGHAIRRNLARTFASAALDSATDDPWFAMFRAAEAQLEREDDLTPYWVYAPEGGFKIERYVPAMPLSREEARYRRLLRTVGAYRAVIGQPRQEDLLRYLGDNVDAGEWLRMDLSP